MKLCFSLCLCLLLYPTLGLANQQKPAEKIMVTLPPLSGLVTMLLPDFKVQCLLSAGADPHHFQPAPRQVDMLNQGHLLLRASFDDQGWPIRVQKSTVLDLWQKDNHAWLRFALVSQALPQLAKSLIAQFPQYQPTIQRNLPKALQKVQAMNVAWSKALQTIKHKGVFMQHPAWYDMLESKGVPVWAVLESHQHGHEHGPRLLEKALHRFDQHPDAFLLGSKRHSNRSLEWLHKHQRHAAPIIKLDALGHCNQPWDALMQSNLDILEQHL